MTTPPMASLPRFDTAAIVAAHDLAAELERRGHRVIRLAGGRAKLRCPFHQPDDDPSCYVYPDGHLHCFGCGAHGTIIDVVMWELLQGHHLPPGTARTDQDAFVAACRLLTDGAVQRPVPPVAVRTAPPRQRWEALTPAEQEVMSVAGAIYARALTRCPGAQRYLAARGISADLAGALGVGFSRGDDLARALDADGRRIAERLRLIRPIPPERRRPGQAEHRDFLAGRLVVPERRAGQPIWLIGRRWPDHAGRPKYLALPGERPLLGYEQVANRDVVYLVEGVFDWLTALAWALPAASPTGTRLPATRLGVLAGARVVYGVLDGDDAGRLAGAGYYATILGPRWCPIDLPDGQDLNDLGRRHGGRAPFARLQAAAEQARAARANARRQGANLRDGR